MLRAVLIFYPFIQVQGKDHPHSLGFLWDNLISIALVFPFDKRTPQNIAVAVGFAIFSADWSANDVQLHDGRGKDPSADVRQLRYYLRSDEKNAALLLR